MADSDSGTNLFSRGASGSMEAQVEVGQQSTRKMGISYAMPAYKRLFPRMDRVAAIAGGGGYGATTNFRSSAVDGGEMTAMLWKRTGMNVENDAAQYNFVKGMLLCHALNSASGAVPDRANFKVRATDGTVTTFNYLADVMVPLGADARRYFRAYADITREVLRELINDYREGPKDNSDLARGVYEDVKEAYDDLVSVARRRELSRHLTLVHDSSESCSNLTLVEDAALKVSKKFTLPGVNVVDMPTGAVAAAVKPFGSPGGGGGGASTNRYGLSDDF